MHNKKSDVHTCTRTEIIELQRITEANWVYVEDKQVQVQHDSS